jgi:phage tail protein X
MSKIYHAKDGERIDQIVYEFYGSTLPVKQVLEDNPHLLNKVTLNAGDKVLLNEFEVNPIDNLPTSRGVALWD